MSNQIDVNQLSNALQQKVDLPSGKSQADIDYVVEWQAPTSENNYTWYRKYKSGWVEQGGKINSVTAYNTTVVKDLIIPMNDTNYSILGVMHTNGAGSYYYNTIVIRPESTSTFRIGAGCSESFILTWEVKGMAAQS